MTHPTLAEIERRVRAAAKGLDRLSIRPLESCAAIVHIRQGKEIAA